jgi:hypothetical protein
MVSLLYAIDVWPASRSLRCAGSAASPFGDVGQGEQVPPREQEQDQRKQCRDACPDGIWLLSHDEEIGDEAGSKRDSQPTVYLPNPDIQWDPLLKRP